jgi:hypothetical protein
MATAPARRRYRGTGRRRSDTIPVCISKGAPRRNAVTAREWSRRSQDAIVSDLGFQGSCVGHQISSDLLQYPYVVCDLDTVYGTNMCKTSVLIAIETSYQRKASRLYLGPMPRSTSKRSPGGCYRDAVPCVTTDSDNIYSPSQ